MTVSQLVGSVPALSLGMQTVVDRDLSLFVFDQSCSLYLWGGENPVSAAWWWAGVEPSCDAQCSLTETGFGNLLCCSPENVLHGWKGLKGPGLPLLGSLLPVRCRREGTVSREGSRVCQEHSFAWNTPCVCARAESSVLAATGMNSRASHVLLVRPLGVWQGCCSGAVSPAATRFGIHETG